MTSFVTSADRIRIATFPTGTAGPTVVAVHGFPDNHAVWDVLAAELSGSHRVVTYDVRGTGASDKPRERSAYRQPHLTDDLVAVVEEADEPVHLLGHDWGSIQCWPALTDPRLAGRILTFTSISGPSLEHAAAWLRQGHRHPRAAARQLRRSWYTMAFQVPALPELVFRSRLGERALAAKAAGRPRRDAPEVLNGIQLYRANMFGSLAHPAPPPVGLPVQVIAPRDDPFVTVELATEAPRPYVPRLTTEVVEGGHWVIAQDPRAIADRVAAFAAAANR